MGGSGCSTSGASVEANSGERGIPDYFQEAVGIDSGGFCTGFPSFEFFLGRPAIELIFELVRTVGELELGGVDVISVIVEEAVFVGRPVVEGSAYIDIDKRLGISGHIDFQCDLSFGDGSALGRRCALAEAGANGSIPVEWTHFSVVVVIWIGTGLAGDIFFTTVIGAVSVGKGIKGSESFWTFDGNGIHAVFIRVEERVVAGYTKVAATGDKQPGGCYLNMLCAELDGKSNAFSAGVARIPAYRIRDSDTGRRDDQGSVGEAVGSAGTGTAGE